MALTDSTHIGHVVDKKRATHINEFEFAVIDSSAILMPSGLLSGIFVHINCSGQAICVLIR